MAVTLQIIGLYYKQSINVPFNGQQKVSVKAVLDAAQGRTINNAFFYYSPSTGPAEEFVDYIYTRFNTDFQSPVSGTKYKAGNFSLRQSFTEIGKGNYTVWQYYVRDRNNTPVKIPSGPETPFAKAVVVEDGFTVIWRLVTICGATPVKTGQQNATLAAGMGGDFEPAINARFAKILGVPVDKA